MRIPSIKTVVTVLVILEVWLLLQVPSIGDLLFNFVVGGELPFTDKVLTPNQMLFFLLGLFILAAGLIFKKEIIAAAEKTPPAPAPVPQQQAVVFVPEQPKVHRTPRVVMLARRLAAFPFAQHILTYVQIVCNKIVRLLVRIWSLVAPKFAAGWGVASRYTRVALQKSGQAFVWLCVTELYLMYRLWTLIRANAIRFWCWLRPHIEQADHWIERKLHQNDQAVMLLDLGREFTATVKGWIVRLRSLLS